MKKAFVFLLIVLMALVLVACKDEPEGAGGGGEGSAMMKAEDGQAALIEQGQSGARGIDYTGFRIEAEFDINGNKTYLDVGGLNDVYWVACNDEEITTSDYAYCKYYNGKDYLYNEGYLIDLGSVDLRTKLFGAASSLLYIAQSYEGVLTKGADEKGCDAYSGTFAFYGNEMTLKFLVDKTYGFTREMIYSDPDADIKFSVTPTLNNVTETPADYNAVSACTAIFELP